MNRMKKKRLDRHRRHRRLRRKVVGTAERPRLCIYRSLKHIYAQIIDDESGRTLVSASTLSADIGAEMKNGGNAVAAKAVGGLVARKAAEQQIKSVVFDRGGRQFHGRIKALADAAREGGLVF